MEWGLTTPLWLLGFALGGWVLGLLAVRDRRWALVPAVTTCLAVGSGVLTQTLGRLPGYQGRLPGYQGRLPGYQGRLSVSIGLAVLLALFLLPRVPDMRMRAGVAALIVPLAVYHLLLLAVFLFFVIFQIP